MTAMARLRADALGSAFQSNLLEQLTGPFTGGAIETPLEIEADGRCAINWTVRYPLVLASLKSDLNAEQLRITPSLVPSGGPEQALAAATFAQYSEAGATVPIHVPVLPAGVDSVPGFEVKLAVERIPTDGTAVPVAAEDIRSILEIRVMEGALGRLLYLLGQEEVRLRRMARELAVLRHLNTAHGDALDRLGAEVGVARFDDEIEFDTTAGEIVTRKRVVDGEPVREPDAEYARRLRIFRPFSLSTRKRIEHAMNGPGGPADPNAGLFAGIRDGHRFRLLEADNRFAVTIHLISVGGAQYRNAFLEQIRRDQLIWPADSAAANAAHAARPYSSGQRARIDALRARLRQFFAFADDMAIAPALAHALDRASGVCGAVGYPQAWQVLRGQSASGGSRYELGLGVDIVPPSAANADDLRTRILDPDTALPEDPGLRSLILQARAMSPPPVADDPELSWFWRLCGLETVHRVDTGTLYLSHFPTAGLAVTGPHQGNVGQQLSLEARYHAPGDPGSNIVLVNGLAAAAAAWTEAGNAAWTTLTDANARARWQLVPNRSAGFPAQAVLQGAGLPVVLDPAPVVAALNQLPDELIETIMLDSSFAASIVAGQSAAIARLRQLTDLLREHNVSSVLPLITSSNEVLLVLGVIGLPQAGINLSERRASGFRWYAVGIGQPSATDSTRIKAIGSRSAFEARSAGLYAVVVLGYARTGLTDPYEFRVELPEGAVLTVKEYEFLMNLLMHVCPIGVEVNTFRIRREHVDLNGDASAEALPPSIFKTFRTFRRRRLLGGYEAEPDAG